MKAIARASSGFALSLFSIFSAQAQSPADTSATKSEIYSGIFVENASERIFFPCTSQLGDHSWWVEFLPGVKAERARYQYSASGFPTSVHFILARGRLSGPGFFGYGFQYRKLVIDSVLVVRDPNGCVSAYSAPKPWLGVRFTGRGVSAVAVAPDSRLLAIAQNTGIATVFDTKSGKKVSEYRFAPPYDRSGIPSMSMTFSRSGKLLAIGTQGGWVHVVRTSSGKRRRIMDHSAHHDTVGGQNRPGRGIYGVFHVASVAFSADEKILVTTGGGRAYMWELSSGWKIRKLDPAGADSRGPATVVAGIDPPRIFARSFDGLLSVYSSTSSQPLISTAIGKAEWGVADMKLSPDERFIAVRDARDSVSLWSHSAGRVIHRFGVPPFATGDFEFSPDSKYFAMAGGAFSVYVWDTQSGAPTAQIRAPHGGAYRFWFTPQSDSVVMTAFFDSTLLVAEVSPGQRVLRNRLYEALRRPVSGVATLLGVVTDSITALAQVDISVGRDEKLTGLRIRDRALSDADGFFVVDSLTPGPVYVRFRRVGYDAIVRKLYLDPGVNTISVSMKRSFSPLPKF